MIWEHHKYRRNSKSTTVFLMKNNMQGVNLKNFFVPMTNHFLKDLKWSINIHYFVDLLNISTAMKIWVLHADLHTLHYQSINPRNENEIWEHNFIGATPSLQQSLQWKTTCINAIIKVSFLSKNFVPMTNHLLKDSKWLINIHYFVELIFNTKMKILVQLSA